MPAEGYKWNQLKAYNAAIYEAAAQRTWEDIRADLSERHTKLTAFMEAHDNDYL